MSDYISLKKYFIEELYIKAPIPQTQNEELGVELSTDLNFGKNPHNEHLFMVTLSCSINYKEYPDHHIKATISGLFETGEKCVNEEMRNRLLSNGAASTLYGTLREIIRAATSQTLYPPLILPIFHFGEVKITFADEE